MVEIANVRGPCKECGVLLEDSAPVVYEDGGMRHVKCPRFVDFFGGHLISAEEMKRSMPTPRERRDLMKLFHIQDGDRPGYVIAESWHQAIQKWKHAVASENPECALEDIEEPSGVTLLADESDLIITERWERPVGS